MTTDSDWQSSLQHDMSKLIGIADILMITLDTLRFDAAQFAWEQNRLTTLAPYLAPSGWECRHSPGSFTYAAHHAFFSGFMPTPTQPGRHPRLFASRFGGSHTTADTSFVFDEPTLPEALSARDYKTVCIGGTGFFNGQSKLGSVLPNLFDVSLWAPELGVSQKHSEIRQVNAALQQLEQCDDQSVFMFINISAIHQPNWFYASGDSEIDSFDSHVAALEAVDLALAPLFHRFQKRGSTFCIVCSDHGTAYGEDGHWGHRIAHQVVWNVPYLEFMV